MWYQKLLQIWKLKDLRNSILFVLGIFVVFRIAAHIPIPGIDAQALKDYFASNQLLGIMNILSAGGMENFSIVAMGVGPYITASIILQLLTMIIPKLEEISKDGEAGRKRINQWTRMLTVPLAALQGYSLIALLNRSSAQIFTSLDPVKLISIIITVTAGTMFLMWLGELISEKHVGNGISLLIFVGIVTRIPDALKQTIAIFDSTQLLTLIVFAVVAVLTIVGVVIITEGQRNVPVSYAKRVRGMKMYGGVNTHLPLRVNMAGVIPIIFAISIILFPTMIAQFFLTAKSEILINIANGVISLFSNNIFYSSLYFLLVFGFTYFYTEVVFHPDQISENLQKQGGFIPGIRPGASTSEYLTNVISRITWAGAIFLAVVAIVPFFIQKITPSMTLSSAGLVIVVGVSLDVMQQLEAQLLMRNYEGFIK